MIGRLIRSISTFSIIVLIFGCIFLGVLIKKGDFPNILMPAHDYEDVLENGLKDGQHIKGEIFYSLGSFASEETYTQYENSRTAAKTSGYYYMIPVGENGMAAIYIRKDDLEDMEALTNETYEYLAGGDVPQTEVHFEGVALKMDKQLNGLENAFREELEYMGYTESEVEEMLDSYSDGECLVLFGPADMIVAYVMIGISIFAILLGIFLIAHNYRKEVEYDKKRADGMTNPQSVTRTNNTYGTSQTTTYNIDR